ITMACRPKNASALAWIKMATASSTNSREQISQQRRCSKQPWLSPGASSPMIRCYKQAILNGETLFTKIGCAGCHIPSLPLNNWMYTEPNPYNAPGNLRPGEAATLTMDLTNRLLPHPRLMPVNGVIHVAAFTDFKLHDICTGPNDPNVEMIDQNQPAGSPAFFAGNRY